jgi:general secretion pathway protein J
VRQRPGREAGFTLLELLVAITVLGLLTGLLASGLGFGARVWERERRQLDQWSELQTVQELVRRMLSEAVPLAGTASSGGQQSGAFLGSEDEVKFVGPPPAQSLVGGIYQYGLASRLEPDGTRLVLTWRLRTPEGPKRRRRVSNDEPEGMDMEQLQEGDEVVLAERLASVRFSFFGAEEQGSAARWRDRWQDPTRLPLLIRLAIAFPPGDRRVWPELTIAPRITAPAGG